MPSFPRSPALTQSAAPRRCIASRDGKVACAACADVTGGVGDIVMDAFDAPFEVDVGEHARRYTWSNNFRPTAMASADILADQIAYYRARAGEYDEWWFRAGRYDRGEAFNAQWQTETAAVESAVGRWLDARRPSSALELACGTGLFTRHLAPRVG